MTDKQRDSINARARELYFLTDEELPERDAFIRGASFAFSLVQDDRLFDASKAAMQGMLVDTPNVAFTTKEDITNFVEVVAEVAVQQGKALLAVLEEEGK